MVERYAYKTGVISIANGGSTVIGTSTAWGGRDWEGAQIWYQPPASPGGAPVRIGTVAAIVPRGEYDDAELPLLTPYQGDTLESVSYELLDGLAIANGTTQAAIYARFAAFLENSMGLFGNTADDSNYTTGQLSSDFMSQVPNNSLFLDSTSRVLYQLRGGVLELVKVVADAFTPRGLWAASSVYEINDLVQIGDYLFVSNTEGNVGNEPDYAASPGPASDTNWTLFPVATVDSVLAALGINNITISTAAPAGGQDNDLWFQVPS